MIAPSVLLQYLVPHHLLSRAAGAVAASRRRFIHRPLIELFIRLFDVDMSEAERGDPRHYDSFNDFFTRPLKAGCRPIAAAGDALISPVDGSVSQCGVIDGDQILQAKGITYSVAALLGEESGGTHPFNGGGFATLYLSPKDYHRVHMPIAGRLVRATYLPGTLFSVDEITTCTVPSLFARNERLVARFETGIGPIALVMVGAMIVAGISTVWRHEPYPRGRRTDERGDPATGYAKGQEIGRFRLGSTVIVITPRNSVEWTGSLSPGNPVRLGEMIGRTLTSRGASPRES